MAQSVDAWIDDMLAQHSRSLYAYAYRLTASATDADDIVQEVLLRALRSRESLERAENLSAYLHAMVRNACWNLRHKNSETVSASDQLSRMESMERNGIEERDWVQEALSHLPMEQRQILLLYFFEDLSYKQIAEALNVPIGTVMSRLSRAKHAMRERLEPMANANNPK